MDTTQYISTSSLLRCRSFRSAANDILVVLRVRASTSQRRSFADAGPVQKNSLPFFPFPSSSLDIVGHQITEKNQDTLRRSSTKSTGTTSAVVKDTHPVTNPTSEHSVTNTHVPTPLHSRCRSLLINPSFFNTSQTFLFKQSLSPHKQCTKIITPFTSNFKHL